MQLARSLPERPPLSIRMSAEGSVAISRSCRQPCTPSCSYTELGHASCSRPAAATAAAAAVWFRKNRRRNSTAIRALFGKQAARQLWDYQGSYIRKLSLEELQLLHRLSFGHRNQRSYLIVLYQSNSQACQDFEAEVERLAAGLRHERSFVAAALDTSSRDAAAFATQMLAVNTVPAVLLYPEAARGCLRFLGPDMSAEGMLTAINNARRKALPAIAQSPGASEWELLDPTTPLALTALRAAAATGDREAVLATLQQQMAPIKPTPLEVKGHSSIWSQGRLALWGFMLLVSLLFLAWDSKLSDMWEDWNLTRRQKERSTGKRFTWQENFDDFTTILMAGVASSADKNDGIQQQQQQQQRQQQEADISVRQAVNAQTYDENGSGTNIEQQHPQETLQQEDAQTAQHQQQE